MTIRGVLSAAALGVFASMLVTPAAAQFDPQYNHLKCYRIRGKPFPVRVRLDNQFKPELVVKLQPKLLCAPTKKTCCLNPSPTKGCQPIPCPADPGLPPNPVHHFKCYKIVGPTTCAATDVNCTAKLTKFPRGTMVELYDQFHFNPPELVEVGSAELLCTPVRKQVVGSTTTSTQTIPTTSTTTTTTTTSSTTTTIICHFDSMSPTGCSGPCPTTAPPGSQCQRIAPDKCDCVAPPVCCECPGAGCFDFNGQCPQGCSGVADAACNAATGHCECGYCRDVPSPTCTTIPCGANQPCPTGTICDPTACPRPCPGPCDQPAGQCTLEQCFRSDGTPGQCRVTPIDPCGCCGPSGSTCTTDFDCCSGICNGPSGCS